MKLRKGSNLISFILGIAIISVWLLWKNADKIDGYETVDGIVRGVNTSEFQVGDKLYLGDYGHLVTEEIPQYESVWRGTVHQTDTVTN